MRREPLGVIALSGAAGAVGLAVACSTPTLPAFPGGEGKDASTGPALDGAVGPGDSGDHDDDGEPGDATTTDPPDGFVGSTADSGPPEGGVTTPLTCDGGPTVLACGNACVDVASTNADCRVCGHDCGSGSSCMAGVCQPVTLYTGAVNSFGVDGAGIYFGPASAATEVDSCPLTGCTLSPTTVASMLASQSLALANGYIAVEFTNPTPPYIGSELNACPETGCDGATVIALAAANRSISYGAFISSPSHFFWSQTNPGGSLLDRCASPTASGCAMVNDVTDFAPAPTAVVASDSFVYLSADLSDGGTELYSCPTSAMACTPTRMNVAVYKQAFAYGDDLYFLLDATGPTTTIDKCPPTGCTGASRTTVVSVPYSVSEFAVDASGAYWIDGANLRMCPTSGCFAAPTNVALNQGTPQTLRLSGGFVYWINATDDTIRRVAEPAP